MTEGLESLQEIEQKLAKLLECSANTLESLLSLQSASQAQQLLTTAPAEFSQLITEIRERFGKAIEEAPKPGIPYYDPMPLNRLRESHNQMSD